MTQEQANNILKKDYTIKSIIKSKNIPSKTLSILLNVKVSDINAWYSGMKEPSAAQFEKLYNIPESRANGCKRNEELMCSAFRQQYVPMDVIAGKETDPIVLNFYGL